MRQSLTRHLATMAIVATATTMGLTAGGAWAAADLVPVTGNLAANGQVGVINLGDTASDQTQMTVICQPAGGASCPEAASMAGYTNPAYPQAVTVEVPTLAPGQSFNHQLGFWGDLVWLPGTYQLSVMVDAGFDVAESNEANNSTAVNKTQPFGAIGTPIPKGPGGFAQKSPKAPGAGTRDIRRFNPSTKQPQVGPAGEQRKPRTPKAKLAPLRKTPRQ